MKILVNIDIVCEFAIFGMVLVHMFTHQIGKGDSELVVLLVSSMHPILLGSLTPLVILGTQDSVFTFLSCIAATVSIY